MRICNIVLAAFMVFGWGGSVTAQSNIQKLHPDFQVGQVRTVTGSTLTEVYEGEELKDKQQVLHRGRIVVLENADSLVLGFTTEDLTLESEDLKKLDLKEKEMEAFFQKLGKQLAQTQMEVVVDPETLRAVHVRNMPEVLVQMVAVLQTVMDQVPESDLHWEDKALVMQLMDDVAVLFQTEFMQTALASVNTLFQYYGFEYEVGESVLYEVTMIDESGFSPFQGIEFPAEMEVNANLAGQMKLSANTHVHYEPIFLAAQLNKKGLAEEKLMPSEVNGYERAILEVDLESHWITSCTRSAQFTFGESTVLMEERLVIR